MITKTTEIREVLAAAKNIFCYEPGGESKFMLVYKNGLLDGETQSGELICKTISDIKRITFCYSLEAWEVIWKV